MKTFDQVLESIARDTATIGGAGTIAGVALLLAQRALLPAEERHRLKKPLRLFLSHLVLGLLALVLPAEWTAHRPVSLLSLFLLLASIGQSILLLATYSYVARSFVQRAPRIIQDIGQIVVYSIAALVTLRATGMEPGSLLTTSALLTAVLGLSLQDTLGNIFAGLALQAEQPFLVGDWIQLDEDDERAGRVVEVNWRATKIVTVDEVELIVPNATLAKAVIQNHSKPTKLTRRSVLISGPYSAAPDKVKRTLLSVLEDTPHILRSPSPEVLTRDFADSGLTYDCRFWIDDFARRYEIEGALRDRLWFALRRAGIEVPYPTPRSSALSLRPRWRNVRAWRRWSGVTGPSNASIFSVRCRRLLCSP